MTARACDECGKDTHRLPQDGKTFCDNCHEAEIYRDGFIHGLQCFAHYKDGEQHVGTMGCRLDEAIRRIKTLWSYKPPKQNNKGAKYAIKSS